MEHRCLAKLQWTMHSTSSAVKRAASLHDINGATDNTANDDSDIDNGNDSQLDSNEIQARSKPKRIRRKKQKSNSSESHGNGNPQASQLSQAAIDAINTVATGSNVMSIDQINNDDDDVTQLKLQMIEMSKTIQKQASEINSLKVQLNFVLSFVGINNPSDAQLSNNTISSVNHSNNSNTAHGPASSDVSASVITGIDVAVNLPAETSAASDARLKPNVIRSNLCQSAVSAMYVEQHEKERRSNSFIISGLPVEVDVDDSKKVKHICTHDLNIPIDDCISKIKRIGKLLPNKIQPVLVILKDKEVAQKVIKKAKSLRQSQSAYVRKSVFINPNQTRAEELAAYQLRCQRRQSAHENTQSNSNKQSSPSDPSTSSSVPDNQQ